MNPQEYSESVSEEPDELSVKLYEFEQNFWEKREQDEKTYHQALGFSWFTFAAFSILLCLVTYFCILGFDFLGYSALLIGSVFWIVIISLFVFLTKLVKEKYRTYLNSDAYRQAFVTTLLSTFDKQLKYNTDDKSSIDTKVLDKLQVIKNEYSTLFPTLKMRFKSKIYESFEGNLGNLTLQLLWIVVYVGKHTEFYGIAYSIHYPKEQVADINTILGAVEMSAALNDLSKYVKKRVSITLIEDGWIRITIPFTKETKPIFKVPTKRSKLALQIQDTRKSLELLLAPALIVHKNLRND